MRGHLKYFNRCSTYCKKSAANNNLATPIILPQKYKTDLKLDTSTYISKLDNGLTVASQNQFGLHCTVGVFVKSAPRYEVDFPSGVSHFIEKLAFQSTADLDSKEAVDRVMDQSGAVSDCQLARDMIIYGLSGKRDSLETMVHLLAEAVCRPRLREEEVAAARTIVEHECHMMRLVPPPDQLLQDLVHQAAFVRNTLGLPRYCPEPSSVTGAHIRAFMAATFRPNRMALVGVGVQHQQLLQLAEMLFPVREIQHPATVAHADSSTPQITGGSVLMEQDLAQYHLPMPEMAHVALGLEGVGFSDPHFVTACVLQSLMGGGGSFSAGGPGKGMYSRLYTEVLNRHGYMNSASALHHSYADCGLFAVSGSCEPSELPRLVKVLARQMAEMGRSRDADELPRAKNLVRASLLMNLEMRPVVFEDIGRQLLYQGARQRLEVEYWLEAIDKVSPQDISDLVQRILHSRVALAGFGRLDKLPSLDAVSRMISVPDSFVPRVYSKFQ